MTPRSEHEPDTGIRLQAYLLLVFTTFCWGMNAVLGRLAVGELSPMALVLGRWLGVSLLVAVFAHRHLLREWPALRPHLPFMAALGIAGYTLFNSLFYVAAHYTTAVNIGILQGSIPIMVLVGAFAVYRIAVTPLQAVGVCLTMIGVVTIASGGDPGRLAALQINLGDLLMVVAGLLYASYTLGLRKRPPVSALGLFAFMAFAAFLAALPMVLVEAALGQFQWPTPLGWLIVALVTVFPSLLAQIAFIQGVTLIGPGRAGIFVNLVPVFASIMAVIFLHEPFEPFHAVALSLVLGGIWLSERGKAA